MDRQVSLDGPWYVTPTAVAQYDAIFDGDGSLESLRESREDLVACARAAHFVRQQRSGIQFWRASSEWYRIGLVVAEPPKGDGTRKLPALIGVQSPHAGWKFSEVKVSTR